MLLHKTPDLAHRPLCVQLGPTDDWQVRSHGTLVRSWLAFGRPGVDFKRTGVHKCAAIVSITTKVEQNLPLKMIQAAFDWHRSAHERVLSTEFYTFRKAVVDPPTLDFDPTGQNWEDSNTGGNSQSKGRSWLVEQPIRRHFYALSSALPPFSLQPPFFGG